MASRALVRVENLIVVVRRQRVILATDLAAVYGVETRALNQAVKRNAGRFPPDFVFRLSREEAAATRRSRSQSVILKRGTNIKYAPLAFTEHGAIMAATVLNSTRAVEMSLLVVRAFVRLREFAVTHSVLAAKLRELELRVSGHDRDLVEVIETIRQLMAPPAKPRRQIGFGRKD